MSDTSNNFNEIGKNLKEIRKSKKITQIELGDLLGKSLSTIQKYESGEIEVPLNVINSICKIFNTEINSIVSLGLNDLEYDSDSLDILSKNIRFFRQEKQLTTKELSLKSGMSETAIYQYQSGLRLPSINALYKIANALGVTQAELLGEPRKEIEIQKLNDEDLIGELKIRGYTILKIF